MKKRVEQIVVMLLLITLVLGILGLHGTADRLHLTEYETQQAAPASSVQAANGLVYTANQDWKSGNVSVINLKTHKLVKVINLGNDEVNENYTSAAYILADGRYVYAATSRNGRVFVIDTRTNRVVKQITPAGQEVEYESGISDPNRHYMYFGRADNSIDVLNTRTNRFEAPISIAKLLVGTGMDTAEVLALNISGNTLYFGALVSGVNLFRYTSCLVGEYNLVTHRMQRYSWPPGPGEDEPSPVLKSGQFIEGLAVGQNQYGHQFLYVTSNIREGQLSIFDLATKQVVATYNGYTDTLPGRVFSMVNLPNNRIGVGMMDDDGAHMLIYDLKKNSANGGKLVDNVLVVPGQLNAGAVIWFTANRGEQIIAPMVNSQTGTIWVFDRPVGWR